MKADHKDAGNATEVSKTTPRMRHSVDERLIAPSGAQQYSPRRGLPTRAPSAPASPPGPTNNNETVPRIAHCITLKSPRLLPSANPQAATQQQQNAKRLPGISAPNILKFGYDKSRDVTEGEEEAEGGDQKRSESHPSSSLHHARSSDADKVDESPGVEVDVGASQASLEWGMDNGLENGPTLPFFAGLKAKRPQKLRSPHTGTAQSPIPSPTPSANPSPAPSASPSPMPSPSPSANASPVSSPHQSSSVVSGEATSSSIRLGTLLDQSRCGIFDEGHLSRLRRNSTKDETRSRRESDASVDEQLLMAIQDRLRSASLPGEKIEMTLSALPIIEPPNDVPDIILDQEVERTRIAKLADPSPSKKRHQRRKPTAFARGSLSDSERGLLMHPDDAKNGKREIVSANVTPDASPVTSPGPTPVTSPKIKRGLPPELLETLRKKLSSDQVPDLEFLHPDLPSAAAAINLPPPSPSLSPMSDDSGTVGGDWMASQSGWARQLQGDLSHKSRGRRKHKRRGTRPPRPPSPPLSQSNEVPIASEWEILYGKQHSNTALLPYSAEDLPGLDLRSPRGTPRVRFRPEVVEIEPSLSYVEYMQATNDLNERSNGSRARSGARRLLSLLSRRRSGRIESPDTVGETSDLVNVGENPSAISANNGSSSSSSASFEGGLPRRQDTNTAGGTTGKVYSSPRPQRRSSSSVSGNDKG